MTRSRKRGRRRGIGAGSSERPGGTRENALVRRRPTTSLVVRGLFVAALGRRGRTWRSLYKANCLRRKRFSAAKAHRGRKPAVTSRMASSPKSTNVPSRLDKQSKVGIRDRIAHPDIRRICDCHSRRAYYLRSTGEIKPLDFLPTLRLHPVLPRSVRDYVPSVCLPI